MSPKKNHQKSFVCEYDVMRHTPNRSVERVSAHRKSEEKRNQLYIFLATNENRFYLMFMVCFVLYGVSFRSLLLLRFCCMTLVLVRSLIQAHAYTCAHIQIPMYFVTSISCLCCHRTKWFAIFLYTQIMCVSNSFADCEIFPWYFSVSIFVLFCWDFLP